MVQWYMKFESPEDRGEGLAKTGTMMSQWKSRSLFLCLLYTLKCHWVVYAW